MNYLRIGDVLNINGAPHIVDMVNESRARCLPLTRNVVTITDRFNETNTKTFRTLAASVSISPRYNDTNHVLEHRGRKGLEEFLAGKKDRAGKDSKTTVTNANQNNTTMANKTKSKTTKTDNNEPKLGKLGGVFGHSTTSVLRRLGKEGLSTAHVRDICAAMKIPAKPTTISIQTNWGKNGDGGAPANLTKAQIKELRDSAPDPEIAKTAEAKAEEAAAKAAKLAKAAAKKDAAAAKEAAKKEAAAAAK